MIEREREISAAWLWVRDERAQLSAATANVALKTGQNAGSQHASLPEPQPLVSEAERSTCMLALVNRLCLL